MTVDVKFVADSRQAYRWWNERILSPSYTPIILSLYRRAQQPIDQTLSFSHSRRQATILMPEMDPYKLSLDRTDIF